MTAAEPYWCLVWRDAKDRSLPDQDAQVFQTEEYLVEQIAEPDGFDHRIMAVFRVSPDGVEILSDEYLTGVCREYLADWEAECEHRESLRRAR